jgi:hypothetical protein
LEARTALLPVGPDAQQAVVVAEPEPGEKPAAAAQQEATVAVVAAPDAQLEAAAAPGAQQEAVAVLVAAPDAQPEAVAAAAPDAQQEAAEEPQREATVAAAVRLGVRPLVSSVAFGEAAVGPQRVASLRLTATMVRQILPALVGSWIRAAWFLVGTLE